MYKRQDVLELAVFCVDEMGFDMDFVNFGGGLGVAYSQRENELEIESLGQKCRELIKEFKEKLNCRLIDVYKRQGLTPEMLPMVINACLAKGSSVMGKKDTIVKNINAMQGFGSMDVLCVDKTGTLTGDKIVLEYYIDILGNENKQVLEYAYLNSLYHTCLLYTSRCV